MRFFQKGVGSGKRRSEGIITVEELQRETLCLICQDEIAAGQTVARACHSEQMNKSKFANENYIPHKCTCEGPRSRLCYHLGCVMRECYMSMQNTQPGPFKCPICQKTMHLCELKYLVLYCEVDNTKSHSTVVVRSFLI
jgi:hypothetical protein